MRQAAESVVRRLRDAGHEAYLVGGCVRDLLLGRDPEDWDVATSARPDEVAALFEGVLEVGRAFGVLRVPLDSMWIEVATFRAEGPYTDGRHPDVVRFTDAREDALRRDFTVNALFLDPDGRAGDGGILDFVGGRADLDRRVLRAVGTARDRFAEDALRLLRAVRLACQLGFEIDAQTWDAIRLESARIRTTSAERIRDELLRILTGPAPRRGMELLQVAGLLREIAPEIEALRGVGQSPEHHPEGDVWEHTLRMLEHMHQPSETLALGALLHDVGKPVTRTEVGDTIHFHGHPERGREIAARLLDRLRVPNRVSDTVLWLVEQHLRFMDTPRMKRSTLRRFVLQDDFEELLELHRLDAVSSRGDLSTWDLCRRERDTVRSEPPPIAPLLNGHELLALGYAPGPALGHLLHALVDAQLEGEVVDRDAALAWVQKRHPLPGGSGGA